MSGIGALSPASGKLWIADTTARDSTKVAPIFDTGALSLPQRPRIAVVHDFLYTYAGAERVLEQILKIYPEADLFSLFDFLPPRDRHFLGGRTPTTSIIQRIPFARHFHRCCLPFAGFAIEQLDLSGYDLILSSSYLVAKTVLTRGRQHHICYCHTPARYAWEMPEQYLKSNGLPGFLTSLPKRYFLHRFRNWDARTESRVDCFLTNSNCVSKRVKRAYGREATVIYPPVDTAKFRPGGTRRKHYLTASRMVPYKQMDVVVEAFTKYMPDRELIVVGDGPELKRIRKSAGRNVTLLGHQPTDRLIEYMQSASAFVFAAEEDFGIVAVEAQACGTPVIAYSRGGVAESVIDGRTGVLFHQQSPGAIADAVGRFEANPHWDPCVIRHNAERFSVERFRSNYSRFVSESWADFQAKQTQCVTESDEYAAAPRASRSLDL